MTTKLFYYDGGVYNIILSSEKYTDGNSIEYQVSRMPQLAIQGWHNISEKERIKYILELNIAGWVEGEETKI